MSEADAIARSSSPGTRTSLAENLRELGLREDMVVLVHSSLSALGWISGGPVSVLHALQDVLTPSGTLVMPAHSADNSDPASWQDPPVPAGWVDTIRATWPAFDARRTPTRGMGRIAELFRTWPDVRRSDHPAVSFAAWGRCARTVVDGHTLDNGLGEGSPLARIYDLDGRVLLLGVGHDRNTSFHLAEYRTRRSPATTQAAAVDEDGERVWRRHQEIALDDGDFVALGAAFEETGAVHLGRVGAAEARLFRQCAAVDFAVGWFQQARRGV